jgi:aluminum resistance protein
MQNKLQKLYESLGLSKDVFELGEKTEKTLEERFKKLDQVAEYNQLKVLNAFRSHRVSESHFVPTTGYGSDDLGRDTLEEVYAEIFGAESALVRAQLVSGTHALSTALSGNLRPGDELLYISGGPYDTLEGVIGIRKERGCLFEYGVTYNQVELLDGGEFDFDKIKAAINDKTKIVAIQRSRGYSTRPTLSVEKIGKAIEFVKSINPKLICMVDNCYGEFVEEIEPTQVGADMIVGSLIKNPGGGLAPIGGYIAGTYECVENAACRLTAPGLGKELGANLGVNRSFYQGLFLAPTVVASSLKSAIFASCIYENLGYETFPGSSEERYDIIQSINLLEPKALCAFCEGIQKAAPIDSFVTPVPSDMPGYESKVIMAAGAFISGASIELSADAPMREPYTVFFQGGLTFQHGKIGVLYSLQKLIDAGIINL